MYKWKDIITGRGRVFCRGIAHICDKGEPMMLMGIRDLDSSDKKYLLLSISSYCLNNGNHCTQLY